MSTARPLKANEIVGLFAILLGIDVTTIANLVGNIPRANIMAWLAGKRENLRHESVLRLMDLVGLKVDGGVQLDPGRVHIWQVKDSTLGSSKKAYACIRQISRLMEGCAITRVEPPTRGMLAKHRKQVFLIRGEGVRVVIELEKSIIKKSRISPEHLVGTLWRDESDPDDRMPHTIKTTGEKWNLLMSHDLAPFEFDQVFELNEPKMAWLDVAMLAREFSVTPDAIHTHILDTYERNTKVPVPSRRGGLHVDSSVILLADHTKSHAA
ncbi:hypothetical protein [Xanthomonas citri]|uniref:hypothetical protein n=1 Tax=Xanthomonas citri TaxID=346 RepID=UPI000CCFBEC5|nr:hypothetical protein [Xanthomonas citri]PNV26586.1 hypothetical protein xavtCFBP7764_22980 [Xanthomonas citri]